MSHHIHSPWMRTLATCFALLLSSSTASLGTEDRPDSMAAYQLGEVVVIAPRVKMARVSEVERAAAEIKNSGAVTVPDALSQFSGALVTTGMKSCSQLSIRGFLSNETLVLFDGRPLNSAYYGDVDLNSISFWGVGKVQVIKGPASSAYGANTLGGMVNIVTDRRDLGMSIPAIMIAGGPDGHRHASLAYAHTFGRFNAWASAGHSTTDGFTLSDDFVGSSREDGGLRENSNYRSSNIDAKLEYATPGGSRFSLGVGQYDAERSAPPTSDTTVSAKQVAYDRFPEWTRQYVCLNATGVWRKDVVWRATAYYDTEYDRLIRYRDATYDYEQIKFDSEHDSRASGIRTDLTYVFNDRWQSSAGVIARRDGVDIRGNVGEPWVSNDAITWSLFDQVRFRPAAPVTLEVGVSLNRYVSDEVNASTSSLDPTATVVFDVGHGITTHFATAQATRFPTLHQLYSTTSGNPGLNAEHAWKFDAGASIKVGSTLQLSQDFFWNDTDDLIDRVSKEDTFYNALTATMKGAESGVEWRSGTRHANLSIAYLDARASAPTSDDEPAYEQRRRWLPRWKVDYMVEASIVLNVVVNHSGQFVADRVNTTGVSMPDYYVANLRVSRDIGKPVTVFATLRNVFDRNYEQETGYPMAGRTILIGLETRP